MSDIFNGPWLNQQDYERFVHLNLISRVNSLELIAHELGAKLQVAQGRIAELEKEIDTLVETNMNAMGRPIRNARKALGEENDQR